MNRPADHGIHRKSRCRSIAELSDQAERSVRRNFFVCDPNNRARSIVDPVRGSQDIRTPPSLHYPRKHSAERMFRRPRFGTKLLREREIDIPLIPRREEYLRKQPYAFQAGSTRRRWHARLRRQVARANAWLGARRYRASKMASCGRPSLHARTAGLSIPFAKSYFLLFCWLCQTFRT